jgi:hypothetical protein
MRQAPSKTWNCRGRASVWSALDNCNLVTESSKGLAPNESVDQVPVSFWYTTMATGRQFDLPYLVEQWDDADSHVEELIALTGDYRVARAAFDEAVRQWPGRIVTLRQKARLLADSRSRN